MRFEEKKFCQIRTLADRWDCSTDRIYDLISKDILLPWHPEKKAGSRGLLLDVSRILELERSSYVKIGE